MTDPLLAVRGLDVSYYSSRGTFRALTDVCVEIAHGEVFGIVGETGCGKSTFGSAIPRLIPFPGQIDRGEIVLDGEDIRCEYLNALWQPPDGETTTTHGTMYRDQRWKLVVYHSHGLGELYDLDNDPHEFHSLWDDADYAAVKAELLQASFSATMLATDPGPAVAPAARGV